MYSGTEQESVRSILRLIAPHDAVGESKVRVGRLNDGGYVMLDNFSHIEAAYSLGINDDVSWDLDIARRGIPVFQYDHTIESLPEQHPLFNWHKKGVAYWDSGHDGLATIAELVQSNGHEHSDRLILKCDIEGSEWGALRYASRATLNRFDQIVLELHWMHMVGQKEHLENVRQTLANLTFNHAVVHVHANNYTGVNVVSGFCVPETLELTLIRKEGRTIQPYRGTFPTQIDLPCDPSAPDLYLGTFSFG